MCSSDLWHRKPHLPLAPGTPPGSQPSVACLPAGGPRRQQRRPNSWIPAAPAPPRVDDRGLGGGGARRQPQTRAACARGRQPLRFPLPKNPMTFRSLSGAP